MTREGYALVNVDTGEVLQHWPGNLPSSFHLESEQIGVAGLTEDWSSGPLAVLERYVDGEAPDRWHSQVGATVEVHDDKVVVSRQFSEVPDIVPTVVTKLALRNAATASGDWSLIKAAIGGDEDIQEVWNLATDVNRAHPMIAQLAQAFEWTEQKVDDLFRAAAG